MRNRLMQRAAMGTAAVLLAGGGVLAGAGTASAAPGTAAAAPAEHRPTPGHSSVSASVKVSGGNNGGHRRGHHGHHGHRGHHQGKHRGGLGILRLVFSLLHLLY
ncbi:hypothetical protein ACFY12_09805 [Streptomyces sp. NPDC001339]|uniref:hypothetical protein n=1 Tax=Streptomyces sp. NPDC001339 TaxID=3364563 RepID=UPI003678F026